MPESSDPSPPYVRPTGPKHGSPASAHRPRWPRAGTSRTGRPAPDPPPWDPRHRRWHNAALRIDGRVIIHAIRPDPTDNGGQRVAPACHTGHDRSDDSPTLHPVYDQPVNCKSCRRNRIAHDESQPYDPNLNQPPLPGMPPIEAFPPSAGSENEE